MGISGEREQPAVAADQLPAPGENYNPGAPTEPRQAASVILLRGDAASSPAGEALEVLLVRRTPKARFMGGVWVFPGGAVDTQEGDGELAHALAGVRELREEAGVSLEDPGLLVRFSRWITPEQVQIRFDTHFFLAELPAGQEPRVDGEECVDLGWFTPPAALAAHRAGELQLVFPTIKHLEQLREFPTVASLMEHARGREVEPVQPRVVLEGEVARILLPGEPGY
ncbi:MAG TPA: NUDIX hydrolase [Solirubrobacteraceae bacterium]|jgi:8-oxo-dGTP pyrophosphatase MutT (NUDIX family)|nr:NUDIX hydrolase [Solirubrobacteraceae bacterium]